MSASVQSGLPSDDFRRQLLRAGRREVAPSGSEEKLLAATAVATASGLAWSELALETLRATRWWKVTRWAAMALTVVGFGVLVVLLWVKPWMGRAPGQGSNALAPTAAPDLAPTVAFPAPVPVEQTAPPTPARAESAPSPAPLGSAEADRRAQLRQDRKTSLSAKPATLGRTVPHAPGKRDTTETTAPPPIPDAPAQANELAAVLRAKRELRAGDPTAALATLAEVSKATSKGVYRQEAAVVRIEALIAAGMKAQAESEAHAFLSAFPNSPYGQRVRAMFWGSGDP